MYFTPFQLHQLHLFFTPTPPAPFLYTYSFYTFSLHTLKPATYTHTLYICLQPLQPLFSPTPYTVALYT